MSERAMKIAKVIATMDTISKSQNNPVVHWDRLEPDVAKQDVSSSQLSEIIEDLAKIKALKKMTAEKFKLL